MAIQNFNTQPARVNKLKGEILAHAMPVEVLGITGMQKQMPKNSGDNVVFRRFVPYGGVDNRWITGANVNSYATDHITTEGVTPSADTLTAVDVTVTLQQYACLYAVTDKTADLYEDDIPAEMKKQTGERVGLLREMVRYGTLKGMTNVFYGGTGNSVSTVNGTLSINLLRRITRSLKANHSKMVTTILSSSPNMGTKAVEASYLVFCSTDLEPAIRELPGFKHIADYGQRKLVHEQEIGSAESFRFVLSPELAANINTGAVVGATGLFSTGGTNIDVYPVIVVGEDVWGQVALRGMDSVDVTYIAPGEKDKNDPLGQRGFIGAKTYMASRVLNDGFGARLLVGTPNLA
jgi:N4-gp56 family major capsid protein